ncbi:hypothetical protein ACIGW8_37455 [Streptomyces sioyaensis]|uniref:hypothetical protein n=1 Tax=Streptomyces sioyaensis TaxID=67364 RepID=UPI0037D5B94A
MSDNEFAAQVAAKLDSVTKEIEELQHLKAKLEDLQQHLVTDLRHAEVPASPTAQDSTRPSAAEADPAVAPQTRHTKASEPKVKQAKKASARVAGSTQPLSKSKPARRKTLLDSPTRIRSTLELLDEQPRSVAEIAKLLGQKHPDHDTPQSAVRNTLENSLVAKSLAHRNKQGAAVFYSRSATDAEPGPAANTAGAAAHKERVAAQA